MSNQSLHGIHSMLGLAPKQASSLNVRMSLKMIAKNKSYLAVSDRLATFTPCSDLLQ